jgi:hypothetical protein
MPNELNSNNTLPRLRRDATTTAASFSGALPGVYRGVIVSRDDPDKQGRVKVALPHIFGDVPVDELPWVYPITSAWNVASGQNGSSGSGGGSGGSPSASALNVASRANGSAGSGGAGGAGGPGGANGSGAKQTGGTVNVPPLGAPVVCMFEGGDHRYPMYIGGSFGKPGFTDTVPQHTFAANSNSPDNYSFTSPRGTKLMSDERPGKEKVFMTTPEGDYVSISKSGLTEIKANGTVSIKGANLVSVQCDSSVQLKGSKVILYSTGDLVVEGASSVNVNSNSVVNVQAGTINLNCNTSQTGVSQIKEVDTTPAFDAK